jgi:hypothetical protein
VLHELGADVKQYTTKALTPVSFAALFGHAECIRVLHELGADINKRANNCPTIAAAGRGHQESLRMCTKLVLPLLCLSPELRPNIVPIVQGVCSFLDVTALNTSEHQYTLYSVAQLAAFFLQRHASDQPQDTVDNFALRFAGVIQDRLAVAPFEAAAAAATTTPAQRLLVLQAVRTAIDAAVSHAATEAKPIDAKLVADVMNLLMSRDRVRDLLSMRMVCKLTAGCSFPVPRYPLLELPTGLVESFVAGSCSNQVPFCCILRAVALHLESAAENARSSSSTFLAGRLK